MTAQGSPAQTSRTAFPQPGVPGGGLRGCIPDLAKGTAALLVFASLYFISQVNYLLFHGITEVAAIAVAIAIFMLVWNTRKGYTDSFYILLGISFLFIAGFDLIHTLAYKGMGVIPGDNADLPTQLWIAARYFQSLTFFIATFLIGRSITKDGKNDATILFAMCTSIAILLFSSIFVWPIFPHAFIEGSGLTPFKIGSEYIISVVLVATIAMLYLKRDHFDCTVWRLMVAAQVFLIVSELAFTSYISVYGFMNILGHLFRLISVYFFYRAIVVVGLLRPYDLLLRELNQDKEILKKNEAESRAILTAAEESIYLFSADGTILQINQTAAGRLGGRTPGEITGHHFSEFINPELARSRRARLDEVILSKKPLRFEDERSGIIFHHTFYPVADNTGTVTRIAVFSRDITERKRTEQKLQESEERFRLVADFTHDWEFWIDPHGRICYISPSSEKILGRPVSQIESIEELLHQVVHPDDLDTRLAHLAEEKAGGGPFEMEFRIIRPDGEVRWIHHVCRPVYDEKGCFLGTRGSNRDITKRKEVEEALRESEARSQARSEELALLMDSVPAAIWIAHDPLGQHITGNVLSYEWLRIPYGSEASKSAMEGVKPETFRMFKDGRELQPSEMPVQQSAGGKEIRNFEFDFVYPEGTVRNVLGNSSPLVDQYNNPKGSVSSYIDITERKRAEEALIGKNAELHALNEELNAIQEELQQNLEVLIEHEHELSINETKLKEALAEKEVLLSEIHHRVKNNLTAFISLLSLEGSTEDTPAGKMLKQDLQNRARSMALIHEILYRTHLYDKVDMDLYLTTLLGQIAQTFRLTKPVKIVIEAHGIMLDIPRATPVGLIINELVTNSFKYAFPGSFDTQAVQNAPPAIIITLTKNDEIYELTVKDNGIGLPPGFDRTKTQTLGLKLVNFLASHQLRATITAGNAMGAEFRFTFSEKGE